MVQCESDLEAVGGIELEDEVVAVGLFFQVPSAELLDDPHAAAGETFVEGGLQHAWQRHHQSGQGVDGQDDTMRFSIDGDEVEGDLFSARQMPQLFSSWPSIGAAFIVYPGNTLCSFGYNVAQIGCPSGGVTDRIVGANIRTVSD
jgi:hypothetical protein